MTISSKNSPARPWPVRATADDAWLKYCLPLQFLLLGLVFATWAGRIPAVRDALHLSAAQLGMALLCAGIGALTAFPLAAAMVARLGQARAALYGGAALLLALPCIALAGSLPLLMLALALLGGAAGCFDVAINATGSAAEQRAGRSIMSMLHAWFCVGTLTGALGCSAMATLSVSPIIHFTLVAGLMAPLLWLSYRRIAPALLRHAVEPDAPAARPAPLTPAGRRWLGLPDKPLLVLGVLGLCGAIAEGAVADWSGVFMLDHAGSGAGQAPLAYAGFSAAMLLTRLVADRCKDRFGAGRVVATGGLLAAAGIGLAVAAVSMHMAHAGARIALANAGFALAGAGLAGIFPFVFSAAARRGATGLAAVASISYCGALVGPPVIGFLAVLAGLPAALASLSVLCTVVAAIASRPGTFD